VPGALPEGDPAQAVRHLKRAGDTALGRLAPEDALRTYVRALDLLEGEPTGQRVRAEILVALGLAQGWLGRQEEARGVLQRAAAEARVLGDAPLLAAAALAHPLGGALAATHVGTVDEALVALLEDALERLPERDATLRTHAMARLATELYFSGERERSLDLTREALAMARRLGDRHAIGHALVSHHYCLWASDTLEERLALSRELVEVGRDVADLPLEFQGWLAVVSDRLEQGDVEGARGGLEEQRRCAEELRLPLHRWTAMNTWPTLALAEGRLDLAERLARETLAAAEGNENADVVNGFSGHMFNVLRERDQLGALEPIVKEHVERFPDMSVWRCALAFVHAQLGHTGEAREQFEILARSSFAAIGDDMFHLFNLCMLAEVCRFLGDRRRAAAISRLLRPHAGRNVSVGGLVIAGAASHYLAQTRATEGRLDESERLFADALAMNERMGFRLWRARSGLELARMLLRRGADGDDPRARALLEEVLVTARELGLVAVEREALELGVRKLGVQR
jgi:tetratricopeptide (TPR) repeat protein